MHPIKIEKLRQFIHCRINQIDQQLLNTRIVSSHCSFTNSESQQEKLHLTMKRLTFSNILSSYLHDTKELSKSYMIQAEIYLEFECFEQAINNAKMAKRYIKMNLSTQKEEQSRNKNQKENQSNRIQSQCSFKQNDLENIEMLIIRCLIGKGKYAQAEENIEKIQIKQRKEDFYRTQCQVLVKLKKQGKSREVQDKLQQLILERYGKRSLEYGLFKIEKGRNLAAFDKFKEGVEQMNKAIDILIEKKYKNSLHIFRVYWDIASYQRKIEDFESQISSLICAQAMVRQLPNQEKQQIQLSHLIVKNYRVRQLNQKALAQLQKVQTLEKEVYGETSTHIGNTLKEMSDLMGMLGKKHDAKKYQQQYLKIVGTSNEKSRIKHTIKGKAM